MKKSFKFVIQGTVQGIFFRQFVKDKADDLNLKGFVRNLSTGEVEIIIEGEKDKLDEFRKVIEKGPGHAHIRHVEAEERKWSGQFDEFKILRF